MAKGKKNEDSKRDTEVSEEDQTEEVGPLGVASDVDSAAREAHDEAEEAGVSPGAVMRSTPEVGVTGDGAVMDPSGEETGDDVADPE